ncbi:hypothetical protein BJF78_32865 [Pseudonocardia sp. CNS-139]|nr:hypothetical protein BJF78_32865 [Pseudonocardia sp. CNS-139]
MPEQLDYYLRFKRNVLPEGPDHFLGRFYYDTALAASPHAFASLLTVADTSHILFGTDYVFATAAAVPATIRGVRDYPGFTPEDVDTIGHGSALALFPTSPPGPGAHDGIGLIWSCTSRPAFRDGARFLDRCPVRC